MIRDAVREAVREELNAAAQDPSRAAALRNAAEPYLPVAAAARLAQVAPGTIRAWIRAGRLTGKRAGRVLRVARGELERFMSEAPAVKATAPTMRRRAATRARADVLLRRDPRQGRPRGA